MLFERSERVKRPFKRPDATMFVLHVTGVHNDVIISLPFKLNSTKIIHQTHGNLFKIENVFFYDDNEWNFLFLFFLRNKLIPLNTISK